MLIYPQHRAYFEREAAKYAEYEQSAKEYIRKRYKATTEAPISIYSVCLGFQMVVGNVSSEACTLWMEQEGYGLKKTSGKNNNYLVFIELQKLEAPVYRGSNNKKRAFNKGFIIY
jgi:hypothetical protein